MNKKEAVRLDNILNGFTPKAWRIRVEPRDNPYCETLEALGYIEIYSRQDGYSILLTERGNEFKARTSFVKECKKKPNLWAILGVIIAFLSLLVGVLLHFL